MTTESALPARQATISEIDPAYLTDPYPAVAAARETGAPYHDPLTGGWYLTRHADVQAVLRDHAYARDPRKAAEGTAMRAFVGQIANHEACILFLDPPDHTRLRGLVTKAFTPRAVEAMRPRAQAICDALLDAVAGRSTFDLMAMLAAPLPTMVIAEMLGVDPGEQAQFKDWSDARVRGLDPFATPEQRAAVEQAGEALDAFFHRAIAERRAAPRSDLISALVAAHDEGDRLSDREIATMCELLLVAGNVTTTDLIGNGVLALLEHPDQLALLRNEPVLLPNAVEEMLRYDSPVVTTGRVVMAETTIGGCPIAAGQPLIPSLAGANRDPAVHPDPDRFDITRENIYHQSFGGGLHYCLGAPLARMEAQVAVGTLLARFPGLRLAPGATPQRRLLPFFRGLLTLEVAVG